MIAKQRHYGAIAILPISLSSALGILIERFVMEKNFIYQIREKEKSSFLPEESEENQLSFAASLDQM